MALFALSVFLGILSVVNKILLFLEKKSGWISGMAIGLISGFYFWTIGLKILALAEFGFFLVMFYGYLQHIHLSIKETFRINFFMSILSGLLGYFFFTNALTIIEIISALSFIWGGYQLANGKKIIGWLLFLLAHITTATTSFYASQFVFSSLQVISGFICVYALWVGFLFRGKTV